MDMNAAVSNAKNIWLSTHISADGDGLGSEIAFYHALKKRGLAPRIVHVDKASERYSYLLENVEIFEAESLEGLSAEDVVFIFDTHDPKLCSPLFEKLLDAKVKIIFVDHHMTVKQNLPNTHYIIDENASCTGELVLRLIREIGVDVDQPTATALYTSLLFDTQSFKSMRDPVKVLQMGQELILAGANHKQIHRSLFENWTQSKFNYLSKLITQVEYKKNNVALISITRSDLMEFNLIADDVSDIVDMFMSLKSLVVSIVIREEDRDFYKLSFRSRDYEILSWAREFGGGGHLRAAGAWVHDTYPNIVRKIQNQIDSKN
jgi:phosphoesterase RecJ-like protein